MPTQGTWATWAKAHSQICLDVAMEAARQGWCVQIGLNLNLLPEWGGGVSKATGHFAES